MMAPFDRSCESSYRHSTVTMALSCIVSKIKRETDSVLAENCNFFHTQHTFEAALKCTPSEFRHNIFYVKIHNRNVNKV